MPRRRSAEKVLGRFYNWLLYPRRGVWYADGRSANACGTGRHSLGTRDQAEARRRLVDLDEAMAVRAGLATAPAQAAVTTLPLSDGQRLYLEHAARPRVLRGTRPSSQKRYRAVLDKFVAFAQNRGLAAWNDVSAEVLQAYITHLVRKGYAYRTQYLEATSVKQVVGWLARTGHLPERTRIELSLRKPEGTDTYCWRPVEVRTMLEHCRSTPGLSWLADVLVALATTGLRISELAGLRQTDIDLGSGVIHLRDETTSRSPGQARTTKSGLSRSVPISADLRNVLIRLPRLPDGFLFHGPRKGRLKPDTVRNILVDEVLEPLASNFPAPTGEVGFKDGRLHSFRHYFVSRCVQQGVPERTTMRWLGHSDSSMVNHYYHLHPDESRRQMDRLDVFDEESAGGGAGALVS